MVATPITSLATRPVGVIAGSRDNEQQTEVVAELAEVILLDNDLPNCQTEAAKFTLLRTIIGRLTNKAVARIGPEPARYAVVNGMRQANPEWVAWKRADAKIDRIRELVRTLPVPVMTTPEPTPVPTPSGVKYVYRMAGTRVLCTVYADNVDQVLPSLLNREDQRAFYRANMPLWDARDLAWELAGELRIVHEGTMVALRVPLYTDAEADAAENTAFTALATAAEALRDTERAVSDDLNREDEDELEPIPYAGDD